MRAGRGVAELPGRGEGGGAVGPAIAEATKLIQDRLDRVRIIDVQPPADVLERTRAYFADADHDVVAVYVFGSVARGTARAGSDVDIAVLWATTPRPTLLGRPLTLADDLRGVLGCPVDVVVLNDAPPDLVHRVLRDGVLVVERDRAARVHFEVRLRNAYFDLLPYLQDHRRAAGRSTSPTPSPTDAPR